MYAVSVIRVGRCTALIAKPLWGRDNEFESKKLLDHYGGDKTPGEGTTRNGITNHISGGPRAARTHRS